MVAQGKRIQVDLELSGWTWDCEETEKRVGRAECREERAQSEDSRDMQTVSLKDLLSTDQCVSVRKVIKDKERAIQKD